MEVINKKSKNIRRGMIKIGFDNSKACANIVIKLNKLIQYAQDASAKIIRIIEIISKSLVKIELLLMKHLKKTTDTFQQKLLEHLINMCYHKGSTVYETIY